MSDYSDIYNSPSFEWLTLDEAFSTLPPALEEKLAEGWIQNNDLHLYVKDGMYRVRAHLRRLVPRGDATFGAARVKAITDNES